MESQAAERNRLLKVLETANIKLANVATDVFGVSGRMILRALIEGKATPQEMAELAKGLLRKTIPELQLALKGKLEDHHRFLLELQLQRLETAEKDLAALEQRIGQKLEPYVAQLALLDTSNSCLFIDMAGIPQPRPDRDDVHYRVREQAMVREVPDYARQ
jgi:transposase